MSKLEELAQLGKTVFEKLGLTQDAVDAWRKVNSIGQRQVNNPMTRQAAIDLGNKVITPCSRPGGRATSSRPRAWRCSIASL